MSVAIVLLSTLAACHAALVHPTDVDGSLAQARTPQMSLQNLLDGRALYVKNCAGCHHLHTPQEYPPDLWPCIIDAMAKEQEVSMTASERESMLGFLTIAGARLRGTPDLELPAELPLACTQEFTIKQISLR